MSAGTIISSRRKLLHMTQRELAEILCVSAQAVSNWERDESLPDTAILIPLSKALQIEVIDILEG